MADVFFFRASVEDGTDTLARKVERLYAALDLDFHIQGDTFVALKIHFGEQGNTGYIRPVWLARVCEHLRGKTRRAFFTDTNTLYLGRRSNACEHMALAREHGFSASATGIPVWISDGLIGRDEEAVRMDLPRIKTAKIASSVVHSDVLLCFSHFTGHVLSGVGAAIKNLGMGCASRAGKLEQHSDVHPWIKPKKCTLCRTCFAYCPADAIEEKADSAFIRDDACIGCGECLVVCPTGAVGFSWDGDRGRVQEKMAEYACAVHGLFGERAGYMNFLIHMTKDCDCMSRDAPSFMPDIGILASRDPLALDKASVDLVTTEAGRDIMRELWSEVDWSIQLNHAAEHGLGSLTYQLVEMEDDS